MAIADQSGVTPEPVRGVAQLPPARRVGRGGRRPVTVLQTEPESRTTARGVVVTGVPAEVFRRSQRTPPTGDDHPGPPPRRA